MVCKRKDKVLLFKGGGNMIDLANLGLAGAPLAEEKRGTMQANNTGKSFAWSSEEKRSPESEKRREGEKKYQEREGRGVTVPEGFGGCLDCWTRESDLPHGGLKKGGGRG